MNLFFNSITERNLTEIGQKVTYYSFGPHLTYALFLDRTNKFWTWVKRQNSVVKRNFWFDSKLCGPDKDFCISKHF